MAPKTFQSCIPILLFFSCELCFFVQTDHSKKRNSKLNMKKIRLFFRVTNHFLQSNKKMFLVLLNESVGRKDRVAANGGKKELLLEKHSLEILELGELSIKGEVGIAGKLFLTSDVLSGLGLVLLKSADKAESSSEILD
eukprot:GDKK01071568.1.p1 GENE.GDKK01071568.1~~GDKK01071568.1.p1  ORF type:complete len:139 (-),score=5.03 GDKK01071568.1:52-468(-)